MHCPRFEVILFAPMSEPAQGGARRRQHGLTCAEARADTYAASAIVIRGLSMRTNCCPECHSLASSGSIR
jgi:hypothetical protein